VRSSENGSVQGLDSASGATFAAVGGGLTFRTHSIFTGTWDFDSDHWDGEEFLLQ
jgi:hypothetical protein